MIKEKKKKEPPVLSSKQKKYLKGLGHSLTPLVLIGKEGITENLTEAVSKELQHHELIKVKVGTNSEVSKHEAAERLPLLTSSSLVQLIGKTVLLYRRNPKRKKDERITIPKA
jgi:RNA-binding protein